MRTWNYRVIRRTERGETSFAIHEVYYDDQGAPRAFSERRIAPVGETFDELKGDLALMQEAFARPLLDYDDLAKQVGAQ